MLFTIPNRKLTWHHVSEAAVLRLVQCFISVRCLVLILTGNEICPTLLQPPSFNVPFLISQFLLVEDLLVWVCCCLWTEPFPLLKPLLLHSILACIGDGCLGWWYRSMLQHKQINTQRRACVEDTAGESFDNILFPVIVLSDTFRCKLSLTWPDVRWYQTRLKGKTANRRASLFSVDAKRNIYAPLFQSHVLQFVFIFLPQAFPASQHFFYETFVSLSLAWQKGEKTKHKTKTDSVLHEGHPVPLFHSTFI